MTDATVKVRKRVTRLKDCLSIIDDAVSEIERGPSLTEILAWVEIAAAYDGFSMTDMPEPGGTGTVSDRTANHAIARTYSHDHVSQATQQFESAMLVARSAMQRALDGYRALTFIEDARPAFKCMRCGDVVKGGAKLLMDNKCYLRWRKAGKPDLEEFYGMGV